MFWLQLAPSSSKFNPKRRRKDINFRWLFLVFLGFWPKRHQLLMTFPCVFRFLTKNTRKSHLKFSPSFRLFDCLKFVFYWQSTFQILRSAHPLPEVMRGKTLACFLLQVHNQHNISRRRHLQCMYIYFPGSWAGTTCSAFWTFMIRKKRLYVIPRFFLTTILSCYIGYQGGSLVFSERIWKINPILSWILLQ